MKYHERCDALLWHWAAEYWESCKFDDWCFHRFENRNVLLFRVGLSLVKVQSHPQLMFFLRVNGNKIADTRVYSQPTTQANIKLKKGVLSRLLICIYSFNYSYNKLLPTLMHCDIYTGQQALALTRTNLRCNTIHYNFLGLIRLFDIHNQDIRCTSSVAYVTLFATIEINFFQHEPLKA